MPRYVKTLLKVAVSGGLICLLYSKLDWSDLADKLRGADLRWLGLAFGLMVLNTFVNSAKWWLFLDADGHPYPAAIKSNRCRSKDKREMIRRFILDELAFVSRQTLPS